MRINKTPSTQADQANTAKTVGVSVTKPDVSELLKKAEAHIEASVTTMTRTVRLVVKSCCGCGCDEIEISRVVPVGSPLKDGDVVSKKIKGDKLIE